jgi:DNA-directed RNA polymerase specialized sigma24 family protein
VQPRQAAGDDSAEKTFALDQAPSREPSPEFAAAAAETLQNLLERLGDPQLRAIAVGKMEGHSNEELAIVLDCSAKTIQRKQLLIRKIWEQDLPS